MSREWLSSHGHCIRQGNLSEEHSHKFKRIVGMVHRPLRQLLWLTGGLPEWLMAYEGKVTLLGHLTIMPMDPCYTTEEFLLPYHHRQSHPRT